MYAHTHMHTHTCVDYIILTIYIFDNKAKCRKFAAEKNETEAVDGIVTMSKAINVHNNNNNNNDYNNSCNNNNKNNSNKQKEIHAKSTLEIGSKLRVRVCVSQIKPEFRFNLSHVQQQAQSTSRASGCVNEKICIVFAYRK